MPTLQERISAWRESEETDGELRLLVRTENPVREGFEEKVEQAGVTIIDRLGSDCLRVGEIDHQVTELESLEGISHIEIETRGVQQENFRSPTGIAH